MITVVHALMRQLRRCLHEEIQAVRRCQRDWTMLEQGQLGDGRLRCCTIPVSGGAGAMILAFLVLLDRAGGAETIQQRA